MLVERKVLGQDQHIERQPRIQSRTQSRRAHHDLCHRINTNDRITLHRGLERTVPKLGGESIPDPTLAQHERAGSSVLSLLHKPLNTPMQPLEPDQRKTEVRKTGIGQGHQGTHGTILASGQAGFIATAQAFGV